ncbi:hypothetical protein L6452_15621 [Arctium lappa]|uniref:Uncharacterized protein n=1 Tax=Arctium lappa TaxID=4217 RepID=A0ACB9CP30_ARCLA|nr:hypothetical protein L6452_15621 [Arctium lappa]
MQDNNNYPVSDKEDLNLDLRLLLSSSPNKVPPAMGFTTTLDLFSSQSTHAQERDCVGRYKAGGLSGGVEQMVCGGGGEYGGRQDHWRRRDQWTRIRVYGEV